MKRFGHLLAGLCFVIHAPLPGQGLDPTAIVKPLGTTDDWPTYSGDYSGKRYSALKQLNQTTVKNLTLAWNTQLTAGSQSRRPGSTLTIGGIGTLEAAARAN